MRHEELITDKMDIGLDAGESMIQGVEQRTGVEIIVVRMCPGRCPTGQAAKGSHAENPTADGKGLAHSRRNEAGVIFSWSLWCADRGL